MEGRRPGQGAVPAPQGVLPQRQTLSGGPATPGSPWAPLILCFGVCSLSTLSLHASVPPYLLGLCLCFAFCCFYLFLSLCLSLSPLSLCLCPACLSGSCSLCPSLHCQPFSLPLSGSPALLHMSLSICLSLIRSLSHSSLPERHWDSQLQSFAEVGQASCRLPPAGSWLLLL